jgi:hypothetical protein
MIPERREREDVLPMVNPKKTRRHRDATGHWDPEYERRLRAASRPQAEDVAFVTGFRTREPLAEELGEAFLESATSGEESEPERRERVLPEEDGGPFVRTRAGREFGYGLDESNIAEATREPLPKSSAADP